MSVIGFDIGNENCVIAVAKQRGIDVLLNEESERETPSIVSFGDKQRFIGAAGAASATTNPRSTISQVKRLIGRNYRDPSVQQELKLFPFETSEGVDGGIVIHLHYLGEKRSFTPTQILGMLFAHLKQIAEKDLGIHVSDCVIGIPSYFTDLQRRLYLRAAQIAGLKVLRLMHDCTATALGFGIYKTDFNESPKNVVFVDVGHCDTQVAIASFEPGHMRILSHAFDSNLGGRDFDEVLFRYFALNFREQYNFDVFSSARPSVRLRAACEKLKKVLSANAEAPLAIECLMDEKDVKGYITREDFEKLSSDLLERISIPCRKALLDSGLPPEKIDIVELVGSGSRIPAISRVLSSVFRREPSRTINASECVARGCALQCAMLSPVFRVREYEVQDSLPFSVGFSLNEVPVCTLSNSTLFPKGHPLPTVKMLTLQRSNSFLLEAFYRNLSELPPGTLAKISEVKIGPFQVTHGARPKVKVRAHINLHGIVTVESASLIEDNDSGLADNNAVPEKMDTSNQDSCLANGSEDVSGAYYISSDNEDDDTKKAKTSRRRDLPVSEIVYGAMTTSELSQAQDEELQLAEQDLKIERTKDRKNSLESYVYDTRNKLLSTYRSFASDAEKEGICTSLQQTEEWLYDDGDDESENVYNKKLEDLRKMVDPIEHRYKDEGARAQSTRDLLNCIVEHRMAAESLPAGQKDAVVSECNKAEQWLREATQHQDSLPKHADPILWSSEIKRRTDALAAMCKHISRLKSSPENVADMDSSTRRDMSLD